MRALSRRVLVALVALFVAAPAAADCTDLWEWLQKSCRRMVDTFEQGGNELILSGYAWHTPWTWTAEKRAEENEAAWGAGWARTLERENGDTDTLFFLVFDDSHHRPEYNLGYAWLTYWRSRESIQPALGYTFMLVARNDIFNGWPFPAVLPLAAVRYDRFTLLTTYIPSLGGVNNGSVFYIFGKIALD